MIAKRGVSLCAVHFYSYPYTSERAKEKVVELARMIGRYCGGIKLLVVPFTEVQLAIDSNCREELSTVLMLPVDDAPLRNALRGKTAAPLW